MGTFLNAACDRCPLSRSRDGFKPVPAEVHQNDIVAVLTDFPGKQDVETGRPLSGTVGVEFQEALDALRIPRSRLRIVPVMSCRPPENNLSAVLRQTKKANTKHEKEHGEKRWDSPMDCCRARMLDDLRGVKNVLVLGGTAASAIRAGSASIDALRGSYETIPAPWDSDELIRVAYTHHPSRVLADPVLRPVFRNDIAKGFRYFFDRSRWTDPEIVICHSVEDVAASLARLRDMGEPISYDVETDGIAHDTLDMRCIAFANTRLSVLVPLLSVDKHTRFFDPTDERVVRSELVRMLANPGVPLRGHNAGQFDRQVCENVLGVTPALTDDTILLHLLADNEMSHGLGFLGSYFTDFGEAWKANRPAKTARVDMDLWVYCAKDACVTEHIYQPIMSIVKKRAQEHLVPREGMLQAAGCSMQRMGIRVDVPKVEALQAEYEDKLAEHERICKTIAGEKFNPRSFPQVGAMLFDKFGLAPVAYSEETGEPSTDDDSLRRMLIQYPLSDEQRLFIESIRKVRGSSKLLGTYLRPLRPWNKTYLTPGGEERPGIIAPDGRIHPSYNRLPATGRYSSSDPNAQNIPEGLRGLFIPSDGHIFVACDSDQLEARYIGEEALAMRMVEVFNSGLDLHNETMEIIYGKGIWQLDGAPDDRRKKGKGTFKNTRAITKNVRYAWQYAAGVDRIWEQVTSAEDEEGRLLFAHLTKDDVREVVDGLKNADPEIPRWWAQTQLFHRKHGYIADRLWGRRRDFKGTPSINEQVNHPIQSGGFHMVAEAMLSLLYGPMDWFSTEPASKRPDFDMDLLKFDFAHKTGMVTQTHDSVMFEVPINRAEEAMAAIQWAMTRRARVGALLTYTAEAKIGATWKDV